MVKIAHKIFLFITAEYILNHYMCKIFYNQFIETTYNHQMSLTHENSLISGSKTDKVTNVHTDRCTGIIWEV